MSNQLLSSKIAIEEEQPNVVPIQGTTTSDTAMVTTTERGPVAAAPILCQGFGAFKKTFGGFTSDTEGAIAAQMFFDNGGVNLWVSRTVHFTDPTNVSSKTSVAATGTIPTANLPPQPASVTASLAGPYALAAADTVIGSVNGGGALTATFNAAAATKTGTIAEPFALSDGQTALIAIDGEPTVTVTFHTADFVSIGAATAAEVCAVIQAALIAASSPATSAASTGHVAITTTTKGTASSVQILSGTAIATLGLSVSTTNGTGNVASIDAVTATEVKNIVSGALTATTGALVSGAPEIITTATGATASIQITGGTALSKIGFDNVVHNGINGGAENTLGIAGKTDGAYGNQVTAEISAATSGDANAFNLTVFQQGALVEAWPNLSMAPSDTRYALTIVNATNGGSDYIALTNENATVGVPLNRPANGTYSMSGGNSGLASLADADFTGNQAGPTGFRCLDKNNVIRILICPAQATPAVHNGMLTYCDAIRAGSMFAILDPPTNQTAAEMNTYVTETALLKESSEFGAIYWPNVQIANPNKTVFGSDAAITVPPSGAIAGTYGRDDAAQPGGVYEAPAGMGQVNGIGFGQLKNVIGLETDEVKDENVRDTIYPNLINPIVGLEGYPIHLDGAKTLSELGDFPTIGERRGVIYIEQSLKIGLTPFKHRKIKNSTLQSLKRSITTFLKTQTRNGAFASDDPALAFRVDTGASINTPTDAANLTMNAAIGLATAKPGEFIVVKIGQDTSAIEAAAAQAAA